MIPDSDLQKWQQAIKGIETQQRSLTPEELSKFKALTELMNNENFEASEISNYIQIMKNAQTQHAKNRLLKAHLNNFVTLCEKYFKVAIVSQPQRVLSTARAMTAQEPEDQIFVAEPQVMSADLPKCQQAIQGVEASQNEMAPVELKSFNTLVSLLNDGNFENNHSRDYIQVIKNAMFKHVQNPILQEHLQNFVTLCEKYFKEQPTAVSTPPIMDSTIGQPNQINKEFYYLDGENQKGPLRIDQLKSIGLNPDTLVWTEGFDEWKPVKEVKELEILIIRKPPSGNPKISDNKGGKNKKTGGSSKKIVVVITIIVVILAAIAGGYFFLKGGIPASGVSTSKEAVDYSLIPVSSNGEKWGYINHKGEYIINPQFENADFFSNGLAKVIYNGKTGYINKKGEYVISATYKSGTTFKDGLALVVAEGERITCIDTKGDKKFVLDGAEYAREFSEGLAWFYTEDRKIGFIDNSGKIVIKAQFEDASPFSEGFAVIYQDRKYGFIDKTGKIVINSQFGSVQNFSEGMAAFSDGRQMGYINTKGAYTINPQFDYASSFSNGMAAIMQGETWGYINKIGRLVINPHFFNVSSFSDGLAAVFDGDRWGYIGKDGAFVIYPQFEYTGDFYNGIAPVYSAEKWGFINKKGQYIINPQFWGIKHKSGIKYQSSTVEKIDYVQSDYYDASEFIKKLFEKESGNSFDGINAATTLEELLNHPLYGADLNADNSHAAAVTFGDRSPITKDIYLVCAGFQFFNTPIYNEVTIFNRGLKTGTSKEYNLSATPDAIFYEFKVVSNSWEKTYRATFNSLKTEIERRYGKEMKRIECEHGVEYFCLIQENGKLNFAIMKFEASIFLFVSFNEEHLSSCRFW